MFRRLISVSVLVALSLSLVPPGPSASESLRRSSPPATNLDQRSWLAGLQSYAALGNWLIDKLPRRAEREREMSVAPPVTAFLNPAPFFLNAPTSLTVTSTANTQVVLSWTAPAGSVDHYQVERSQSIFGPFMLLANAAVTSLSDGTVSAGHAYLYRVRAVAVGGAVSLPSNMALGTAISFEFSSLQGQLIKAQHFYDVRTAVNAVRALANLPAATWSPRQTLAGSMVEANDVQELRNKLGEALAMLDMSVAAYTDATLSTGANGTLIKAIHLEQLQTGSTRGSSNSAGPLDSDSSTARLDPMNATGGGGENPLSRNFNWNLPLVSLPGRSGMGLGLTLAYNSLVWTKNGSNSISFDDDHGFPGPGFRLGFPVIQPLYYNAEVGKYAYLLIGPDSGHTELRQVGNSVLYEAADSSHLLLDSSIMVLRTTDGTQLNYVAHAGQYDCTQIKDRNGNYVSVTYTPSERINTVTDTLGRVFTFNYDVNGWLTDITQVWNQNSTPVTHYWARFEYANIPIDYNFGTMTVVGLPDNSSRKMLSRVKLADDSYFDFSYSSWAQVWKVSNFAADNHLLNYRFYNLPQTAGTTAYGDCPRFTERRDWAQYWNGDIDGTAAANEEAVTTFAVPVSDSWTMPDNTSQTGTRAQVTTPDGTYHRIYFIGTAGTASGWRRSLPALVNTYDSANVLQRQAMTTWTQDNTAVSYELNPRVTETNLYDPAGNRARTQTAYQQFTYANGTSCQFPRDVFEYAANATTILRSTRVDYHTSTSYTDRRILGLVAEKRFYEGDVNNGGTLMSKVGFYYDNENGASSIQGTDAPVQHDNTNYTANFITGRGNLSSVRRYDVTNTAVFTTTKTKFNTAGAVVSSRDALDHEVTVSYADSFSDGNNTRNTLAYPTTVTDPDGYSSTSKYHFDFGATTYVRTPQPNVTTNTAGPEQTFTFDVLGRLQQKTNVVNGAYTRFEYPTSQIRVDTYATIQEGLGEAHSFQITDGVGRMIATASDHPGSIGGFSGQRTVYDVMGRFIKTSNPTETSASGTPFQWTTAGDDATAGWIYTQQTYDWKGRPRVTTNQDGTTKTASYAGCGCAGGEVVTLTDEGTIDTGVTKKRQQKIYSDVLGRTVKTEILNWEAGSVYSATVNTYNARDQITQARQYQGPSTSGTYQDTSMTYDGYGRLQSKHVPEENTGTATTWTYNADDSVNTVTDARGAVTTMGYAGSNRGLVKSVTHTLTGSPQINVSYNYDAVGNRILMTDSLGTVSYGYDQLSRMTSETRTVTGVSSFALSYTYNLAGQLASYNTLGQSVSYTRDQVGSLTSVSSSGSTTPIVSNIKYRAWGGRNELTYGDNHTAVTQYNNRLLPTNYSLSNVMTRDYSYFADGRLKSSDLTQDGNFYRVYEYDHAGRLKSDSTPTNFAQNVTYDVWDNVTQSEGWHWSQIILASGTYANNRHSNWQYNAAGQVTVNDDNSFTYDAAGRMNTVWPQGFASAQQIIYDGDGQVVGGSGAFSKLRSTVLGGRVVAELFNTGQMSRSFVYAEGEEVVAFKYEGLDRVIWEHRDTAGQSVRQAEDTGIVVDAWDETASGAKIEHEDPYPSDPDFTGLDTDGAYPHLSAVGRPMTGCTIEGIVIPDCSWVFESLTSGNLSLLYMSAAASQKVIGYRTITKQFKIEHYSGHAADDLQNDTIRFGSESTSRFSVTTIVPLFDRANISGLLNYSRSQTTPSPQNTTPQPAGDCASALGAIAPGLVSEHAGLLLGQGQQQGLSAAQLAYVFASAQHETDQGNTLTEYASGRAYNGRADLGNTQAGDGPRYKGRGFVQLTGRNNYQTYTNLIGQDLIGNPSLAADPQISAFITVHGLINGTFTGKRLGRYINDKKTDFVHARRTVNSLDRARRIARYANKYLNALKNCGYN